MFSIFNRFFDWFLMRQNGAEDRIDSPAQLMQAISDVTVLLAEPDGKFASEEAKEALLQSLIMPLNERPGLSIRPVARSFKPGSKGSLNERFEAVVKEGRSLLKAEQADLLVWGMVELEEQAVRWYFLPAHEGGDDLGVPGVAENLLVPFAAEKGTLDVFYAALFAACVPSHPTQALKIGEHLLGAIEPLTKLPAGLSNRKTQPAAKASTMGMCAVVLANIARRGKEIGWFEPAINAFENWESLVEKDKRPFDWALTTNHYGWLYEEMASHEDDDLAVEHIEKALKLFESVCTVFNSQKHPHEWASVQLRMGGTCARIGRTMSEPAYLQKAARYYKKALDFYTQSKYPLNWADTLTKMAKALMLHGQLIKGAQSLEQAGVAFQGVLNVYTQEKYPALWASTHNNLGATLFALAKRDPSTPQWLEHGLQCFHYARDYYAEHGKAQMVHVIDKNIARAQALKDQIEEDQNSDLLN